MRRPVRLDQVHRQRIVQEFEDTFVGGERLANLRVYYDFSWYTVFGHGRSAFPHGQSLGSIADDGRLEREVLIG